MWRYSVLYGEPQNALCKVRGHAGMSEAKTIRSERVKNQEGLVQMLIDGEIPAERAKAVLEEIMTSPDRRKWFIQQMHMHQMLVRYFQNDASDD